MENENLTYKSAGVDIEAGYEAVSLMKKHIKKTFTKGVLSDIGGFGGLFSINKNEFDEPILVSGTDGVGTKLKIAFSIDKHDTIGEDCVAMCVNDILCQGAKPLFFLDYIATGKLNPEKVASIVEGIANGCVKSDAALIGGETAEMPGLYNEDEYDLAGFAVGIVDKKKIIDGSKIKEGNIAIGLQSSGIHSNGYSLVRKIIEENKLDLNKYYEEFGKTLGEELLTPTKIYVKPIMKLIEKIEVNGLAHITGGGFLENIPRILPNGLSAQLDSSKWKRPRIFDFIKNIGNLDINEMYKVFNMGIGMIIFIDEKNVNEALNILEENGEKGYKIGEVIKGEGIVIK